MAVLKRIGPGSAFKIGFVSYTLIGFIAGLLCSLIALSGVPFALHSYIPWTRSMGVIAVIVCPLAYGVIGGMAALISALIYNLSARWVGGIEVEIL
jgi:hypothetical protein